MNKRSYLIAAASAELKAKTCIAKFDKEFKNGNQNRAGNPAQVRQDNNAQGNVPQQPIYGG